MTVKRAVNAYVDAHGEEQVQAASSRLRNAQQERWETRLLPVPSKVASALTPARVDKIRREKWRGRSCGRKARRP